MKDDIIKKVEEIIDTKFEIEEVDYIPDIENSKLTFGNKGLKFTATVLHIDMRGSTKILNDHNRSTVAKIHMAYFHTIVKIASSLGGAVRSFNGDSMLVFFPGKTNITNAVQAAMEMKYMISDSSGINSTLAKYSAIDFGIGIDYGEVLCTKIGVSGNPNNKGLFWAGNAVNKSVKISDLAKNPNHVYLSKIVYDNISDHLKFVEEEFFPGYTRTKEIWTQSTFTYNGTYDYQNCYYTTYHVEV
nr:adenylate/guanylate cyclase domain-containing protein [Cytobacillus sp. Bac17]